MKVLPPITKTQQEIIILIHRYRFINRTQLQYFLNHKYPSKINLWLKDLLHKNYIKHVEQTPLEKLHKPAIYYIGLNGLCFLKQNNILGIAASRKYYTEDKRSDTLRNHCLILADFTVNLLTHARKQAKQLQLFTKADCENETEDTLFSSLHDVSPDAYYNYDGTEIAQNALVEIIDEHVPMRVIKRKLDNYIKLQNSDWSFFETKQFPSFIFILFSPKKLAMLQRLLNKMNSESSLLRCNLTLASDIQTKSLTEDIWITV